MSPESDYKFDLFLRYHRSQARWTRQLAERLDRDGFRVWLDAWMLQPGDDRRLEQQLALDQCRWIGLVLSPEFVSDPWPKDELYSGFPHAPARQNQRLLPLIHTPCELPAPLHDLPAIDFSGSEEDPILFEYQALQLMSQLDPDFAPPEDLQRFRLQNRTTLSAQDEELRGFQAFLRAIQDAISQIARGDQGSSDEEGLRQITVLQFIQRLFQWNTADVQFDRAEDWFRRGNFTEALIAYDRALNMDPNFALAWARRGDALVQLQRFREAIDSYNGSLSINPYDEAIRLQLALLQGRMRQYKAAVVNYDRVLEINPDDVLAWHNRGIRLLQLDRPKLAIKSLNKALRYDPKESKTWMARGYTLLALNRPKSAVASFAEVAKLAPRRSKAFRLQGYAYVKMNRFKSALKSFSRSLKLKPKDPIARYNRGVLLLRLGRPREAVSQFDRVFDLNVDLNVVTERTWYARGFAFQTLGYWQEASEHFQEALRINPNYFPAQYAQATALQTLGRDQEAIQSFDQILQDRPKSFACLYGKVTSLRKLQDWATAWATAEIMIDLNDHDPLGWFALALTASDQGNAEAAVEYYSQVLALTPTDPIALNNRAWNACVLENYAAAQDDALQATELDPDRSAYWHTLGRAQAGLGLVAAAMESLKQALALDPEFPEAQADLQKLQHSQTLNPLPDLAELTPESEPIPSANPTDW